MFRNRKSLSNSTLPWSIRQTHFHLLHKRDRTRVEQRMVDAETEKPVPPDETRKAFEAEPGLYVVVTPEEIERSGPEPSREVKIRRCVPTACNRSAVI